ncbi:putative succinyl-CoA transferase [Actinorhabdospora filicis]|uniref:Succinyl-CoA transferase n=1 Tax=Actinorhabdospora filicis TaxID=1785913 RepID=A0A9W6W978_9ACTN|nr:GNAT family N-acetyltransferase [Actinorhabdospora filicis]GLZ77226.1 putative succinyl-CoA transferase [Actinorhabdospora filicis]
MLPLHGLLLRTPLVELRVPGTAELLRLGEVAADGVHDAAIMPFQVPWTDLPPAERARSVVQNTWAQLGRNTPGDWGIPFAVFHDGEPVGHQRLRARNFAVTRTVGSGSWIGRRFHGRGFGTHARAAILHLAFTGLGADYAESGFHTDNLASAAVSGKLGYHRNGEEIGAVKGERAVTVNLRMSKEDWAPPFPIEIEGLETCLSELGVDR